MNKADIQNNILSFSQDGLRESSLNLFKTLGYTTERQYRVSSIEDFKGRFLLNNLNEDKALYSHWKDAQFLFELQPDDLNSEETEITGGRVGDKDIETYWFYAIELKGDTYSKKQLSDITREVNKVRTIPAFILFKYANKLTFSIIDRRLHKRNSDKDVLEKVVLIKDINFSNPHRAHIDILEDLFFEKIKEKYNVTNFVGLHENWLKTLSVSELNKDFYKKLSNWFFWAVDVCQMSKDNDYQKNIMFCIRMITRIIFNWFIKEKGLLDENIFKQQTYLNLLKPEYREQGDLYYKVILQNLFFGCLSMPMEERRFRNKTGGAYGQNGDRNVNIYYRYEDYFKNSSEFLDLVKDIPFINGGLFECLDDKDNKILIDCFTDNNKQNSDMKNFLNIPDDIFFMEKETIVDLSSYFDGDKGYKKVGVRGLFPILNSYKFTIDETTPIEEEIALDPELLGRVFENLLAAHNPETKTTARKSTGSYYTPREIVDYMCEQSLINYLKTKVEHLNIANLDNKLTELLSYSETQPFDKESEVDVLIKAVNEVKILDPACGSGAFPMGLLHKLVHILSKLDPNNDKWKSEQLKNITDPVIRQEIDDAFKENDLDYSRKLYLIQNCIYGVDIQPMATQISRLRFFISLIVDEKVDKNKDNMGIYALPNLETKFVAANTLIGLDAQEEHSLFASDLKCLKDELTECRKEYFNARKREKKNALRKQDKELREKIIKKAEDMHFEVEKTAKLVSWNPYAKDVKSDWFDSKWMFNVEKFDIVIANPPYIGEKGNKEIFQLVKNSPLGKFYQGKMDYFYFFFHLALDILKDKGQCAFITTNYYVTASGAKKLRPDFEKRSILRKLINFNELKIFESALGQHNMITILTKGQNNELKCELINVNKKGFLDDNLTPIVSGTDTDTSYNVVLQNEIYEGSERYIRLTKENKDSELSAILDKIQTRNDLLGNICNVNAGIMGGCDFVTPKNINYTSQTDVEQNDIQINDGVFVLDINNNRDARQLNQLLNTNILKKFYKNSDISKFTSSTSSSKKIIFSAISNTNEEQRLIKNILSKYKNILTEIRKINNENIENWFILRRGAGHPEIFNLPKIVAPQRSKTNTFGYNECEWYASADVYFITEPKPEYNLKYILALLNSNLYYIWLYNKGKRKGESLELYQKPLSEIPIKKADINIQSKFVVIVDKIIALSQSDHYLEDQERQDAVKQYEKQIDIMAYKLYELTYNEIMVIDPNFSMSEQDYNNYKL